MCTNIVKHFKARVKIELHIRGPQVFGENSQGHDHTIDQIRIKEPMVKVLNKLDGSHSNFQFINEIYLVTVRQPYG